MKPKPNPSLAWPIPLAAVEMIADYESLRLKTYRCPAGVPTIGWGQTADVSMGMTWTKEEADRDLCRSLQSYAAEVTDSCTREPTPNELGAMVSLQYNIGAAAFKRSSVLKAHNRGDTLSASRAFGLWNQVTTNGVRSESRGLTARRASEAALYLQPGDAAPSMHMPQAVESTVSLARSPIMQSSTAAVGLGVMSVISQTSEHLGSISGITTQAKHIFVDTLGIPGGWVLPGLLVAFGAISLWSRVKQRVKGWA